MLIGLLLRAGLSQRLAKLLGIAIPVVVAIALLGALWARGNHYRGQRDDAREQVAKWKAANEAATLWAIAEKAAKETAATTGKDIANDNRRTVQAAAASAGADHRRANRCVLHNPAKGRFERTDLPRPDSAPGQFAPEAGNAELVAVDPASFNACTVNSADLNNAYEWGQDLVAKGLAR